MSERSNTSRNPQPNPSQGGQSWEHGHLTPAQSSADKDVRNHVTSGVNDDFDMTQAKIQQFDDAPAQWDPTRQQANGHGQYVRSNAQRSDTTYDWLPVRRFRTSPDFQSHSTSAWNHSTRRGSHSPVDDDPQREAYLHGNAEKHVGTKHLNASNLQQLERDTVPARRLSIWFDESQQNEPWNGVGYVRARDGGNYSNET